jgi:nucleoside-diphosphate-sugar epimerase
MSNMMITGGSGFIGSALCNRLAEQGHYVVAFDNFSRSSHMKEKLHPSVDTFDGDVRDAFSIDRAFKAAARKKKRIDTLWHLAYINGTKTFYSDPSLVLDVGVRGAINTIEVALANNVKKYVLVSTSEVYNEPNIIPTPETAPLIIPDVHNPRFSYSGGKIISELLTIHSKLDAVIVRPHNIYGCNMGGEHVLPQLVEKMLRAPTNSDGSIDITIQGDGSETRSFCYIDDCIGGMILASQTDEPNAIFNVGVSEETSIIDLTNKIASILGLKLNIITSPKTNGSPMRRCPDITKISSLGYSPKVSLNDGLRKTVEWYKKHLEE